MAYLSCFFISYIFLWLGTKKYRDIEFKIKKFDMVLIFIGLIIPALLAANRSPSVGSDVSYYVLPYFNRAVASKTLIECINKIGFKDIGYIYLNFIVSRFSSNIFWLFFAIEFIILIFLFLGNWNYRKLINPAFAMLIWYFLLYNMSLSTVRQSIALSIIYFATSLLIKNNFKNKSIYKALILLALALLFHFTAISACIIWIILYYLINNSKINKYQIFIIILFVTFSIRVFANSFVNLILKIALVLGSKYSTWGFTSIYGNGASGYVTLILMGIIVSAISLFLLLKKDNDETIKINKALFACNILYVFFMLLCSNITFIPRMMYYLQILWCITLAQFERIFKKTKFNNFLSKFLIILVIMLFWYYYFCISNVHGTFPYQLH